jgi:hypothetical protein
MTDLAGSIPQPWYTVVIPTRDSAGWIGTVLERYRSRGVIPILLVDTRTKDDTKGVARRHQARVVDMPSFSFTEGVVALTRDIVETPWVLFAHDDEIPSDGLFAYLRGAAPPAAAQSVAIRRRWAWYEPDKPLCYGHSEYWRDRGEVNGADHHWRLFRPKDVTFVSAMHSDGFLIDRWIRMPPDAYLVHFEWVIRSRGQRVAKLRRYDRARYGYGRFFANMYLPEDQPPGIVDMIPFETGSFDRIAPVYYAMRAPDLPEEPLSLADHWARIKNDLRTWLGLNNHAWTPKDREGLKPKLELEIVGSGWPGPMAQHGRSL